MKKKTIAVLLVAGILLNTNGTTTFATPNRSEAQTSIQLKEQEKNDIIKRITESEAEIYKYNSKIEGLLGEVDKCNLQIANSEQNIEKTNSDLKIAEEEVVEQKDTFGKRLRALYVNGVDSYLEILLSSDGLYDFISKTENLRTIAKYDKKIMSELEDKGVQIAEKKIVLEEEKKTIIAAKAEMEENVTQLNASIAEHSEKLTALNTEKNKYSSEISQLKDIVSRADAEAAQALAAQVASRPSRGDGDNPARPSVSNPVVNSSGVSGQDIVNYAYNFLGANYVWGAQGPSTFDCSGLTSYVYGKFGMNIGRTTYSQINSGRAVSRGELQPGDLVLFGTYSNPYHVGIYVGSGSYVHAPTTGDVVKVSSFRSGDNFLVGRRIIN